MATKAGAACEKVAWSEARPAPILLITGSQEFLAERALAAVRSQLQEQHPQLEVHDVDAASYSAGTLQSVASPSLFAEPRLIRVASVDKATDAFLQDAEQYLASPADDVTLVLRHAGGNRGRGLLTKLRAAAGVVLEVTCPDIKYERDRVDFVLAEFRRLDARINQLGARMLVSAYATDLAELAAACSQLVTDVGSNITEVEVQRATEGRVETNGFKVADAAAQGRAAEALVLLRQALATGAVPVQLLSALSMKVRQLARVYAAKGSPQEIQKRFGMPDWMYKRAQNELRGWQEGDLARGVELACETEYLVKGGSRDAVYALEKLVIFVSTRGRSGGR